MTGPSTWPPPKARRRRPSLRRPWAARRSPAPGRAGRVVTYLHGRQVPGVRLADDHLVISVRSRWGVPAAEVARQVRVAVTALAGARRIDVFIAEMADRDAAGPPWPTAGVG